MTHKDEASKLALEALSSIDIYLSDTLSGRVNPEPATYKQWLIDGIIEARKRSRAAITAIKQARAAPDTQRHNDYMAGFNEGYDRAEKNARNTTPPTQPAPVQEPKQCGLCGEAQAFTGTCGGGRDDPKSLCYTPPAAQHQCKWPTCQSEEYQQALAEQIKQELVTGAAQRQWVPMTQELLNNQHPWLYKQMWIALKDGSVFTGIYEWRQGRYPDRLLLDGAGNVWAFEAAYVMPVVQPEHPDKLKENT